MKLLKSLKKLSSTYKIPNPLSKLIDSNYQSKINSGKHISKKILKMSKSHDLFYISQNLQNQ